MGNENLFKCPDCGNEVSRSAKECPKCGNKKIKKQIRDEDWEKLDPKKKRNIFIGVAIFIAVWISVAFIAEEAKPDPCNCYEILNVPTKKVGIGMPLPIEHLPDSEFLKYEECHEEYAGPAGALLECAEIE